MRIYLNKIGAILMRTCDGGELEGYWVSWCPELDIVSQGPGKEGALYMLREAVRIAVECDVSGGNHPLRRSQTARPDETDPALVVYRRLCKLQEQFRTYHLDGFRHNYRFQDIPEHVEVVFTRFDLTVDTFGYTCVINDSFNGMNDWYYETGDVYQVSFKEIQERTFEVDGARFPDGKITLEQVRELWGPEVSEIIEVKKL